MPVSLQVWTAPMDARLRRMRVEGETWVATAAALGMSQDAAIAREQWISASYPPVEACPQVDDPGREPLSAGHPLAWAVLTDGTWLEGLAYPPPQMGGVVA